MSRPFNSTCCPSTALCRRRPFISSIGRFMMAVPVLVATIMLPALAQSIYQPRRSGSWTIPSAATLRRRAGWCLPTLAAELLDRGQAVVVTWDAEVVAH